MPIMTKGIVMLRALNKDKIYATRSRTQDVPYTGLMLLLLNCWETNDERGSSVRDTPPARC